MDRPGACRDLVYLRRFANTQLQLWQGLVSSELRECASIERLEDRPIVPGTADDVAIVHLTRASDAGEESFAIRADAAIMGESVVAIGFPAGLPLKIDDGGKILGALDDHANYATASIDDFIGSSGGPVLDADGALLGLALGGRADFTYDKVRGCSHTAVVSEHDDVTHWADRAHVAVAVRIAT